jgi:hypothetical protein
LTITKTMLVHLLTYHQVLPDFLEFLFLFGQTSNQNNIRFSGFREQTSLDPASPVPEPRLLGRSGRHFEICYNLKTVNLKKDADDPKDRDWSIRQAGVHHKFDVIEGNTLWTIVQGSEDLQKRIKQVTGQGGRPEDRAFGTLEQCFSSSLAIHMLIAHWATEQWRWHIQWLEELVEAEVSLHLS